MFRDFNWRLLLLGGIFCVVASAASPYVTLKLGMSVDLTLAGMFVGAYFLARHAKESGLLANQLNIIQSMIGAASGITFMVVIMAAFHYLKVFGRSDINFDPPTWQLCLFLLVSAVLGIFMGVLPRSFVLKDKTLPWPTAKATLAIAETLSDPEASEVNAKRRMVLMMSTAGAGFLTFLREGLGVITPIVGNKALGISLGLEFMALGFGLLVPLSVGLSGLLGVWIVNSFGEIVAQLSALNGTSPDHLAACVQGVGEFAKLEGDAKKQVLEFLTTNCGKAAEFVEKPSHFKFVVQWMMWPATAMMISAALVSIIIPFVRRMFGEKERPGQVFISKADENIPRWWVVVGIIISIVLTVWMTTEWFGMSLEQSLLAVLIQPVLIISGLRVLGITGQGPVSLMANATQFLFGLIWPAHVVGNLNAAYVSANPQASSENVVPSFWVAQRIGGKFKTLILAQLIVVPIGAILTPLMFKLLQSTYGIGLEDGQLSAPTGIKIASLAMVMEKGLDAMPSGALTASLVAALIGVLFEVALSLTKRDAHGDAVQRFPWVPIPSALGFSLILPPVQTIGIACGAVAAYIWRKFGEKNLEVFGAPLASGFIAGEAMVASVLMPFLVVVLEMTKKLM